MLAAKDERIRKFQGYRHLRVPGIKWCADNGCYGKRFNEDFWWRGVSMKPSRPETMSA